MPLDASTRGDRELTRPKSRSARSSASDATEPAVTRRPSLVRGADKLLGERVAPLEASGRPASAAAARCQAPPWAPQCGLVAIRVG
jgi:hypothetical protein